MKAIYQNWKSPISAKKGETVYVHFDISPTCQIMNIRVVGNDTELTQSLITALQNTKIEDLDYQEFKNNSVTFRVR